jgi:glycosyltransferase involved in cell wall biosynthesis
VIHKETGYLAKAFDVEDLAFGIQWVLGDRTRLAQLGANARAQAITRYSSAVIAAQYQQIYGIAIEAHSN